MMKLLPLIALAFVAGCTSFGTNDPEFTGSVKPVSTAAGYCNRIAEPSQRSLCLGYHAQFE